MKNVMLIPTAVAAAAIMTSSVVTLKDDATIADARRLLNAHSLKATAVVDAKGRLRGVLKMSDVSPEPTFARNSPMPSSMQYVRIEKAWGTEAEGAGASTAQEAESGGGGGSRNLRRIVLAGQHFSWYCKS